MQLDAFKNRSALAGIGYINIATFAWATNMVLGRWLRNDIGPVALSAGRFIAASVLFAILIRHLPAEERRPGQDRWLIIAMALSGIILFSPVLYYGLHFTTAVNCTLINGTSPLVTGLFAALLLREGLSARQASGAILGFLGVMILISGGSISFWLTAQVNAGDLLVLLSVVIWALYSVFGGMVLKCRSSLSATALSIFIGTPILCLLAAVELMYIPVKLDWKTILSVIYLGIVPGAIGFWAWNQGVSRLGPGGATVFINTLPLYGALLGVLFLGEPFDLWHIAGGLLIISGGITAAGARRA